jgi:hypothetical protein
MRSAQNNFFIVALLLQATGSSSQVSSTIQAAFFDGCYVYQHFTMDDKCAQHTGTYPTGWATPNACGAVGASSSHCHGMSPN